VKNNLQLSIVNYFANHSASVHAGDLKKRESVHAFTQILLYYKEMNQS